MQENPLGKVSSNVARHFSEDIWHADRRSDPVLRRGLTAFSRWLYLVAGGFMGNQSLIRASALTFTTILSIVPFLAVAFALSKGFGLQNTEFIRGVLLRITGGRGELVELVLAYIANTNVKALGWLGVTMLLLTVFSMVGTVEKAFNTIWGVRRGRTPWRKFTDFFSVILVCPLIVLVAASFTVKLHKNEMLLGLLPTETIGFIEAMVLKLVPYLLIWIAFVFAYAFIPNTRVRIGPAVLGGFIGGFLWQSAQWGYIMWQVGVAKYNAIYGSFAQLPLLLVWLYISWAIVLLGAEMTHAAQNLHAAAGRRFLGRASAEERQKAALLLMVFVTRRFEAGGRPHTMPELAGLTGLPEELAQELLQALADAGLLVMSLRGDGAGEFVPAVSAESIRIADVIRVPVRLGASGRSGLFTGDFAFVDRTFDALDQAVTQSPANATLAAFAHLADAQDEKSPAPDAQPPSGDRC